MYGRFLLLVPTAVTWKMQAHPRTSLLSPEPAATKTIVWRFEFPPDVVANLVSCSNPTGGNKNSDLEISGSVFHHNGVAHCFDVRERTVLSRTDNMATMWW